MPLAALLPSALPHRPAGRCSDPIITINRGGPRRPPTRAVVLDYVPVKHTVYSHDPLYETHLWLYFDFAALASPRGSGTLPPAPASARARPLWYRPNRTLIFSDAVDLARHIGQRDYNPTSNDYRSKHQLMAAASRVLVDADTVVFTHHLDRAQACGVRCCHASSHAEAARRYADYKPRNASTSRASAGPLPFASRYYSELVALRGFKPHTCPAHVALRREVRRATPTVSERILAIVTGDSGTGAAIDRACPCARASADVC